MNLPNNTSLPRLPKQTRGVLFAMRFIAVACIVTLDWYIIYDYP